MTLIEWFSSPQQWPGNPAECPECLKTSPLTILNVFAALLAMTRGGYGSISYGPGSGVYQRQGLHAEEARALTAFDFFVRGWLAATNDREATDLSLALEEEWKRVGHKPREEAEQ